MLCSDITMYLLIQGPAGDKGEPGQDRDVGEGSLEVPKGAQRKQGPKGSPIC